MKDRQRAINEKIDRMTMRGCDFSLGGRAGINSAIELFLDDHRKLIFIKSEIYNNSEIDLFARQMLQQEGWRTGRIWADSAQPALMNIAKRVGVLRIKGVNKGIKLSEQLQALQNYTYIINFRVHTY